MDVAKSPNVSTAAVAIVICTVGLIGNVLAIVVVLVLKEYKVSVTHWYILQLAFADLLFLLTLPFKVSEGLNNAFIYPEWICGAVESILFLNYYSSIIFLVIMSLDRYIAVCHSYSERLQKLRKQKCAFIIIVITLVVSLLLCIPVAINSHKTGELPNCKCLFKLDFHIFNPADLCRREGLGNDPCTLAFCLKASSRPGVGGDYCRLPLSINNEANTKISIELIQCLSTLNQTTNDNTGNSVNNDASPVFSECNYWGEPLGWKVFIVFNFTVMFLIPVLVMSICYTFIVRRFMSTRVTSQMDKDRRRVTLICVLLVSSFIICWLPFHSVHLAKMVGIKTTNPSFCGTLFEVGTLFAYTNSALNPFLYGFMGANFRKRWRRFKGLIKHSSHS